MNKENSRFKIAVVDDDEMFARKICQTIQKFWRGKDAVFYCSGAQYVERKPLKTVFSELPETEFAYINSGQIVNLMRIAEFNKDEVKLDSGAVLHCSRRMKKDFEAKMLAFWERL